MADPPVPADIFLTEEQLDDAFTDITMRMLGYNPADYGTDEHPSATSPVRTAWPADGAPAWGITEDIAFLRVYEVDSAYNRQREVKYLPYDNDKQVQETTYTRVVQVDFVLYGPNAFDNAAALRDKVYYQDFHDILALQNLYLVTDIAAPRKAPENHNGQWWRRVDLSMQFNELVARNVLEPYIHSAEITVYGDNNGSISTATVNVIPEE